MNDIKKNSVFYIETTQGYTFKILAEIINSFKQRPILSIDNNGIIIRFFDNDNTQNIFFNIELERKKFNYYNFNNPKPLNISINIQHFKKHIKNVQKKDVIAIFLDAEKSQLGFIITQTKSDRKETNYITYKEETDGIIPTSTLDQLTDGGHYNYPKVLSSFDFGKLKKNFDMKTVTIEMQSDGENNINGRDYLSFYATDGGMTSSITEFGIKCEDKSYTANFKSVIFTSLIKLSSITQQVRFYEPNKECIPLYIESSAGELGNIKIFIKDEEILKLEEKERSN